MTLRSPTRPRRRARRHGRAAFTLVEVMIVVAVLAIIAGAVVPQVGSTIDDAKQSAMLSDLTTLTKAIERYKVHHTGQAPDDLDQETLLQLTSMTDATGQVGSGQSYVYGPYLLGRIPPNPLNSDMRVYEAASSPPAELEEKTGWWYHKPSGQIWAGEKRVRGLLGL